MLHLNCRVDTKSRICVRQSFYSVRSAMPVVASMSAWGPPTWRPWTKRVSSHAIPGPSAKGPSARPRPLSGGSTSSPEHSPGQCPRPCPPDRGLHRHSPAFLGPGQEEARRPRREPGPHPCAVLHRHDHRRGAAGMNRTMSTGSVDAEVVAVEARRSLGRPSWSRSPTRHSPPSTSGSDTPL